MLAERIGHHVALTDDAYPESPAPSSEWGSTTRSCPGGRCAIRSRTRCPTGPANPVTGGHSAVRVETPFGPWPVLTTHTDHRFDDSATRQVQCERILQLVDAMRAIPSATCHRWSQATSTRSPTATRSACSPGGERRPVRNLVLTDCWEVAGDGPGATWRRDNPYQADTAWPDRRLDYVFVAWPRPKPVGNPLVAWLAGLDAVDGVHPSDHAAVVVDLATPDPDPPRR